MKIGRNDPCSCGSGKKYKHCHLGKSDFNFEEVLNIRQMTPKGSQFTRFLDKYKKSDLLNLITALQTNSLNHGKNIRIEIIAKEIVKSNGSENLVDLVKFYDIVADHFPSNSLEDLPEACFTENIVFFGGNYIVTPGIAHDGADIFRTLIDSIFIIKNDLPIKFKNTCYSAIVWLLELSKVIFARAGLKRFEYQLDSDNIIKFPDSIIDYSFSNEDIENLSKKYSLSKKVLDEFIVSKNDKNLNTENPDLNPLIRKPLHILDDRLYFILPSTQLSALNEFILNSSIELGCKDELLAGYNFHLWMKVNTMIEKMGWGLTNIQLPERRAGLHMDEIVCRIDDNKLVYVCFTNIDMAGSHIGANNFSKSYKRNLENNNAIDTRLSQVVDFLKTKDDLKDYEFMTLIIHGSIGRDGFLSFSQPVDREKRIWFSAFEFLKLVDHEKWDVLSIWKFAKVYGIASKNTFIQAFDMVDAYYMYKKNAESIHHPDKEPGNFISILPGTGSELLRLAIKNEDLHGALMDIDGVLGNTYVRRSFDHAPIYKPLQCSRRLERLIECFNFPLWLINDQVGDEYTNSINSHFLNAIAFWLLKMRPGLEIFNALGTNPVYLNIVLENKYFEKTHIDEMHLISELNFSYELLDRTIKFNVPFTLAAQLHTSDNTGERFLMEIVLRSFNSFKEINLSDTEIKEAINHSIPISGAKMILFMDTEQDLRIDPRWLLPNRYITEADISLVLDSLAKLPTIKESIPEKIKDVDKKVRLCNSIVYGLILKLREKLAAFDPVLLLRRLILMHEGFVQEREYRKIHIPAKIACFSDIHSEVQKITDNEERLVASTLCIRCLIEFIAADPIFAGKLPNFDEIDQMMALMNEVISYGFLSDAIYLGIDNPEIGLLPSGRIGTSKDFFTEKLKPFSTARSYSEIESYIESFPGKFKRRKPTEPNSNENTTKVNRAFELDWGISLRGILDICEALSIIAEKNENSICEMESSLLIDELVCLTKLNDKVIIKGINKLVLTKRRIFDSAPEGFKKNDIYPWKYNRELAFHRRPLILIEHPNGNRVYYWGLRNSFAAAKQILHLLYTGRLGSHGGTNIDAISGEINYKNVKYFRDEVKDWFKNQPYFNTIENEVSIKPNGYIKADKDYGDIDVCSIDTDNKIIYSIECKATEQAKNIHEMKNELDKYLERTEGSGLLIKHIQRDTFLRKNLSMLSVIISNPEEYSLVSLVVTSEDLPLTYIQDQLPLPFISFPKLRRDGTSILLPN
jgi:hypothetical protein